MVQNKTTFTLLFLLLSEVVFAQITTLQDSTHLFVGSEAYIYTGPSAVFDGTFNNQGLIQVLGDVDFRENRVVGKLAFRGNATQRMRGDSLVITSFRLNKSGNQQVIIEANQVTITDSLDVRNGVLVNEIEGAVEVTGYVTGGSNSAHIEGNIIRVSDGSPMIFPLGINGTYNEIEVSNIPAGEVVFIECDIPDPSDWTLPEDIVGVADEVQWTVVSQADSLEISVALNYSGIDLNEFSVGNPINADTYEPAIAKRAPRDTAFVLLSSADVQAAGDFSEGQIVSRQRFYVYNQPTIINIARVPALNESVLYVPNAFSPTGLFEENQTFRPFFAGANGESVSSVRIVILDNLRNEIYRYTESGEELDMAMSGWDGLLPNGQLAEEGIYYYIVNVVTNNGEPFSETGSFLLTN